MHLVCGLGNPERQYRGNRHNVGFMVVDALAQRWSLDFSRQKFQALLAQGTVQGSPMLLVKPQSFMNLSGGPLTAVAAYHHVAPDDLLVVHDELDLPFGTLRFKRGGGTGGHRGLESIAEQTGGKSYARLRFGIGRPAHPGHSGVVRHVLSDFSSEESAELPALLERAGEMCEAWRARGLTAAMNHFNAP